MRSRQGPSLSFGADGCGLSIKLMRSMGPIGSHDALAGGTGRCDHLSRGATGFLRLGTLLSPPVKRTERHTVIAESSSSQGEVKE